MNAAKLFPRLSHGKNEIPLRMISVWSEFSITHCIPDLDHSGTRRDASMRSGSHTEQQSRSSLIVSLKSPERLNGTARKKIIKNLRKTDKLTTSRAESCNRAEFLQENVFRNAPASTGNKLLTASNTPSNYHVSIHSRHPPGIIPTGSPLVSVS